MKKLFVENLLIYYYCLMAAMLLLSSCKEKGCTDRNALNYNSVASEDDGSCIYCKSTHLDIGDNLIYLFDNNPGSQYYNQPVAIFEVIQVSDKYNDTSCGDDGCVSSLKITSMVNKQMTFSYHFSTFGGIFINYDNNVVIPANAVKGPDAISANSISNPCNSVNSATLGVYVTGGYIIYQ